MPISFSSSANHDSRARGHGVTAVLGPTNTGKTHLAIERMLGHSSGIIGLPLRLLAREVYNKIVERIGAEAVALITGEEKIKPPSPRYWVATVEAMPLDLDVAFVAVDEVQLGADLDRGHVFTDRMLNRRGREETLVLGAATMRPMVEKLLPGANTISRPRLSQLTFSGEKKISRQPRRTAIVTFSTEDVYAIAELIRRQRGGAAVVLGALSPRTRNAQVALYQSGDVDYLVATDAIGMGLNLDVDHVAFASDRKFDGFQYRRLIPSEFAQIAGRAGRATRDGTFGTTGRCPPFENELVQALESHAFESVKLLQWRNTELDFASIGALSASLAAAPTRPGLARAPIAEDILVLEHAARDDEVRSIAKDRRAIERLWDVCQIPDYRKISPSAHAELAVSLYGFLMREGRIPTDWFARQIALADHADGDIDTLSNRIAHIRTWTFVANRPDWLDDPHHWQGVARAVEDKLSDALHERLAERFIDRRTSVLMRRMRESTMLETEITKTGEVVVEGHVIGRLDGFRFSPDAAAVGSESKALSAAAQRALAGEIDSRATRLSHASDSQFVLASNGLIRWMGDPVAKIFAGENVLRPRVRVLADEHLTGAALDHVQTRLDLWTRTHIERVLGPLFVLGAADDVSGIARGIAFQLVEALGVLERHRVADDLKALDQAQRATLRKHGVRFGAYHIYLPALLKPAPRALAAELWALKQGDGDIGGLDELQRLAASGRTSFPVDKSVSRPLYRTIGYRACGERAVRVDILERLADLIRPALSWRPESPTPKPAGAFDGVGFTVTQAMTSLTGSSGEDFASILRALGYRMEKRPRPAEAVAAAPDAAALAEAHDQASAAVTLDGAAPESEAAAGQLSASEAAAVEACANTAPTEASAREAPEGEAPVSDAPVSDAPVSEAPVSEAPEGEAGAAELPAGEAATVGPCDRNAIVEADPMLEPEAAESLGSAQESILGADEASSSTPGADARMEAVVPTAAEAIPLDGAHAQSVPAAAEEPQFIEVWRPARHDERVGARRRARAARPAAQVSPVCETPPASSEPAPANAEPKAEKSDHRPRHRSGRPGRGDGPRHQSVKPDEPPPRQRREQKRDWQEKAPDPDSPFAKLAALKAQLEANAKERR